MHWLSTFRENYNLWQTQDAEEQAAREAKSSSHPVVTAQAREEGWEGEEKESTPE